MNLTSSHEKALLWTWFSYWQIYLEGICHRQAHLQAVPFPA